MPSVDRQLCARLRLGTLGVASDVLARRFHQRRARRVRSDEIAALVDQAVGIESEQLHPVELTAADVASNVKRDTVWPFILCDVLKIFDDVQKHREDRE